MKPGLDQKDSWQYMQEMLPLVRDLWHGDVAHDGKYWQFPTATSCHKPLQETVPMWVAARAPITFDYAVTNDCNIMNWPLTQPFSEAEKYRSQLDDAIADHGGTDKGSFAMMRHTSVYDTPADRQSSLDAIRAVLSQFGNLMMKSGEVRNGFPDPVPLETIEGNFRVEPKMLEDNLMFGSPDQVIDKLAKYQDIGVDAFIYYASMGLGMAEQKKIPAAFH
jgi:alkanesulfonate monooxygenase SsuD/methylene tetrahydromethanopterin reductase-like flavin-dependent oxidoreductase (luciferase family)